MTFRAEAGAWPLWLDGEPVDPAAFGLPDDLLDELDAWALRLAQVDGWFDDPADRDRFDDDGRVLWERVVPFVAAEHELVWRATFSTDTAAPPGSS